MTVQRFVPSQCFRALRNDRATNSRRDLGQLDSRGLLTRLIVPESLPFGLLGTLMQKGA